MPQSRHLPITKFFVALAVPLMLSTAPTWADDACEQNGVILPGCNYVTSKPLTQVGEVTLYCPSQEPYHWPGYYSKTVSNNYSSRDFSASEFVLAEENLNQGVYSYFQWFGQFDDPPATLTITQGCSPISPNGNCQNSNGICQADPNCPGSTHVANCFGEGESYTCLYEWGETCVQGDVVSVFWCNNSGIGPTCCYGC